MLKRIVSIGLVVLLILSLGILFYVRNPYAPQDDLAAHLRYDAYQETSDAFVFKDESAVMNIIIIPGGLVTPEVYLYMASELYLKGHQVTIVKPPLYLAIMAPNQAKEYIEDDMKNVIIGHSLGGTVGSMIAADQDIDYLILLGSYSTQELSDTEVLLVTASEDTVLNMEAFNEAKNNVREAEYRLIEGGNHAQFGWYTGQTNDGTARLSILGQQREVISLVQSFIDTQQGLEPRTH